MSDEEVQEILEDSKQREEKIPPLEVKVVNEVKKEFDELEHDDDEYQDMGITKEQLKEFEDDKG